MMKRAQFLTIAVTGLIIAFGATGCVNKRKQGVTPIPGAGQDAPGGNLQPAGPESGNRLPGADDLNARALDQNPEGIQLPNDRDIINNMLADREALKAQTLYFDYDRSNVRPSETPKVEAVSAFLKNEANTKVQIEGHCDERGTEGYNLSLGEKRALSVRDYLITLGISADRVFTISWGEDKPASDGHNEDAWHQNRRAEFILLRPKP